MNEYASLFRLREVSDLTLSELETPHLFFATPDSFKDKNDANILGFIEEDDEVYEMFNRFLNDSGIIHLTSRLRTIGICCFTTKIPSGKSKGKFMDWRKPICIEYDSQILERAFTLNQNGIIPFHIGLVSYHKQPLLFKKDDETPWHILWEEIDDGHVYKSLKSINLASKDFDELVKKMFTRLSKRYNFQKEVRFISRPLSELDSVSKGYWLDIPNDAIIQVLVSKTIPEDCEFMIKLHSIPSISEKIVYGW